MGGGWARRRRASERKWKGEGATGMTTVHELLKRRRYNDILFRKN
jgi:hypothetical protein